MISQQVILTYYDIYNSIVIAGDFNESHNGFFWGKACQWLEKIGIKDAINQFDSKNTWYWPLPGRITLKARFDHIFYSRHFECTGLVGYLNPTEYWKGGRVVQEGASDHFPVFADLKLSK